MPNSKLTYPRRGLPHGQRGVILIVSLVVLVAMMLAAVSLIRSVETSTVIAGNMSFQQATLSAGDVGVAAAATLLGGMNEAALQADNAPRYYATMRAVDANRQLSAVAFNPATPGATPAALDWSGVPVAQTVNANYEVKVVIDRLCTDATTCVTEPPKDCISPTVGVDCNPPPPRHYRATVRVEGPRNTVSLTQTILSFAP